MDQDDLPTLRVCIRIARSRGGSSDVGRWDCGRSWRAPVVRTMQGSDLSTRIFKVPRSCKMVGIVLNTQKMSPLSRRELLDMAARIMALAAWPGCATADDYPSRPIRLVIPYTAGA